MALYLDISTDDILRIGEDTFITLEKKSGQRARLRIIGTAEVEMKRKEKLQPTDEGNGRST